MTPDKRQSKVGKLFLVGRLRSCLEIRVLEVALRLWSVQGAMGA
ncbi:MAG: hypothetical protein BECKG1743D_GA0114223_108201, partial [Candidatus Kentron sp. G]